MFTYLLVVVTRKSRKRTTTFWCALYLHFWMCTGTSEMDCLYENVTHIHCSWNDAALLWLHLHHVQVLSASHCMQHNLLVQRTKCWQGQWEIYIYMFLFTQHLHCACTVTLVHFKCSLFVLSFQFCVWAYMYMMQNMSVVVIFLIWNLKCTW